MFIKMPGKGNVGEQGHGTGICIGAIQNVNNENNQIISHFPSQHC